MESKTCKWNPSFENVYSCTTVVATRKNVAPGSIVKNLTTGQFGVFVAYSESAPSMALIRYNVGQNNCYDEYIDNFDIEVQ